MQYISEKTPGTSHLSPFMFHTEIKVVEWTYDCIVSNAPVLFPALMYLFVKIIHVDAFLFIIRFKLFIYISFPIKHR